MRNLISSKRSRALILLIVDTMLYIARDTYVRLTATRTSVYGLVYTCPTLSNGFACVSQYLSIKTGIGY